MSFFDDMDIVDDELELSTCLQCTLYKVLALQCIVSGSNSELLAALIAWVSAQVVDDM